MYDTEKRLSVNRERLPAFASIRLEIIDLAIDAGTVDIVEGQGRLSVSQVRSTGGAMVLLPV